jgi:hypothetical protein
MSGNRGNRGRRRPRSPCYCDTAIAALNAAKDSIWQLEAALEEEQRTVATLRRERDEAQNNTKIWERDLLVLRGDHRLLQASYQRLLLRFANLQYRIQQEHPDFQVSRVLARRRQE